MTCCFVGTSSSSVCNFDRTSKQETDYEFAAADADNGDESQTIHPIVEIAALSLVIWLVWRWRNPYFKQHTIGQEVSS